MCLFCILRRSTALVGFLAMLAGKAGPWGPSEFGKCQARPRAETCLFTSLSLFGGRFQAGR